MRSERINTVSVQVLIGLALAAWFAVLSGYFRPHQFDEVAAVHIFQVSIVAFVPTIIVFLATADWKRPLRSARLLAFPATALALAFGALYYLEHNRF